MKTNGKVKKSGSADRPLRGLRLSDDRRGEPRTARTAVRSTPKLNERTGNVYENKEQGQNVDKLGTRGVGDRGRTPGALWKVAPGS